MLLPIMYVSTVSACPESEPGTLHALLICEEPGISSLSSSVKLEGAN